MKRSPTLHLALLLTLALAGAARAEQVPLTDLDLNMVDQDYGRARANRSVDNKPMSIGGQSFSNGFGTHAFSQFIIDLQGQAEKFTAKVGVDDEAGKGIGSVMFKVTGD